MDILRANDEIMIEVAKEKYTLNCSEALSFIKQFRSIKMMKTKTLGIVSKSLLISKNTTL